MNGRITVFRGSLLTETSESTAAVVCARKHREGRGSQRGQRKEKEGTSLLIGVNVKSLGRHGRYEGVLRDVAAADGTPRRSISSSASGVCISFPSFFSFDLLHRR